MVWCNAIRRKRLVDLDGAEQSGPLEGIVSHRLAAPVAGMQSREARANPERPFHLVHGDRLLGLHHELDFFQLLSQRQVKIVNDGAQRHIGLVLAQETMLQVAL